MAIEWEEPPEEAFLSLRKGTYGEFALALKARPGQWAKVDRTFATEESAKNMASNVRRGGVTAMPKGLYEAVSHGKQVWCRYMPPEDPAAAEPAADGEAPAKPEGDGGPEQQNAKGYASRVRAWAKIKGIQISDHGRINEHIQRQYERETGDRRPA